MGFVLGLVLAAPIGLFVAAPWALTHKNASELERSYGAAMIGLAARFQAPQRLPDAGPDAEERGRQAYSASCALCHGNDGRGKGVFGQTTFPPATDLLSPQTRGRSDAELFWIVNNGLGFTAMPGYAGQLRDADIAAVVSYVRSLQHAGR
jgi:mono/diheme cytochrome c family protein